MGGAKRGICPRCGAFVLSDSASAILFAMLDMPGPAFASDIGVLAGTHWRTVTRVFSDYEWMIESTSDSEDELQRHVKRYRLSGFGRIFMKGMRSEQEEDDTAIEEEEERCGLLPAGAAGPGREAEADQESERDGHRV